MIADQLTRWATTEPSLAVLAIGLLLLAVLAASYLIARRTGASVFAAAIGAIVCTAYSGDTSWGFARDHLGMASRGERLFMFAAGEIALVVCGVMARTNKRATAAEGAAGTPAYPASSSGSSPASRSCQPSPKAVGGQASSGPSSAPSWPPCCGTSRWALRSASADPTPSPRACPPRSATNCGSACCPTSGSPSGAGPPRRSPATGRPPARYDSHLVAGWALGEGCAQGIRRPRSRRHERRAATPAPPAPGCAPQRRSAPHD
ncbi:hypothetical protein ACFQ3Z_16180 [Streptomyces nogalater]